MEGDLKSGYYIQPTIIEGLDFDCEVNQEEIFGPVVSIIPFDTEEVIEMANSTKYGLSASIFTENISKGHRVAAAIESGVVWINTWLLRDLRIPFGGMKHSGVGREGGFKSLEFFTEPKMYVLKFKDAIRFVIEIVNINAEEIRPLRHAELRQGQDFSSTSYLRDNDKETFHLACRINRKVITCATFYPEITDKKVSKNPYRLRGMATHVDFRRKGYAAELMNRSFEVSLKKKDVIYCGVIILLVAISL